MRAAVYHGRGDIRIEEVAEPRPGPGELLLHPLKVGICGTDAAEYAEGPLLVSLSGGTGASRHRGPVVLGHEFVAEVVEVATDVEGFRPGERVVTGAGVWCGECEWCLRGRTNLCREYYAIGLHVHGGLAPLVTVPARTCVSVPPECADESAAMAQPMAIALHALDRADVSPGDSIAVIGVGGVGAFVLAAAESLGLGPLVAVDISPDRLAAARKLTRGVIVDAGADDATAEIQAVTDGGADVVIEASGSRPGVDLAVKSVRRGGWIVLLGLQTELCELDLHDLVVREITLSSAVAHNCPFDLPKALEVLSTNDLSKLLVDRVIPLDRVIDDGIEPLMKGTAKGKILVQP